MRRLDPRSWTEKWCHAQAIKVNDPSHELLCSSEMGSMSLDFASVLCRIFVPLKVISNGKAEGEIVSAELGDRQVPPFIFALTQEGLTYGSEE